MAKGEYAIQISAKVQVAIDALQSVQKELKGVGGAVEKTDAQVKGLSVEFLAFGATLVGTATSVAFIGAAVEKAMFKSGLAIQRAGADADKLAKSLQGAGRSAAELLPVGAAFAQIGFAGKDLAEVTEITHQFSRVMGMSAKEAGAELSSLAAAAGIKTPEGMRRLASGLDAVNKMFPDFSKGNADLLRTLAPTAVQMGITADKLSSANVLLQKYGVSAGDAKNITGTLLENIRYGPDQITAFATAMGLPADQMERFRAMDPAAQFQEMFAVMKEGGMVTRENVPMLMSYLGVTRETGDALVRMANSGEDVNAIFGAIGSEFAKGTFLQKDFTKWTETLYGAMDQLWQTIRGLAEDTAPLLAMVFTGIVKTLTILVKVVGFIPGPIRALVVAFLGLSGVVMLVSKFLQTNLIKDFKQAARDVWGFGKKVLLTSKALAVSLWDGLKKAATAMWGYIAATGRAIAQKGVYLASLVAEKFELMFVTAERWFWIAAMKAENFITTVAMGIKAAYLKIVNAEIWSTMFLTAKKWVLWAAEVAVNIVTGIGVGIKWLAVAASGALSVATGFLAGAFWALAAGVWAAMAPLLPFIAIAALVVAAVVGLVYIFYKLGAFLGNNWSAIWGGITAGFRAAWVAIKAVWGVLKELGSLVGGVIMGVFNAYWRVLTSIWGVITDVSTAIWDGLIGGLNALWGWVVSTGEAIAAPFLFLWDVIKGIGDAIGGVIGWLFGSSMFHLKEGVAEVMPSLGKMEDAFTGIGRAAGKVGLESHIPDDIRVRIAEPATQTGPGGKGGLSAELDGKQAIGGPAGSGPTGGLVTPPATQGAAGAGEGTTSSVRVVVPVTVTLDGDVIARAISEHEINTGQERYMNASLEPMRGTGR